MFELMDAYSQNAVIKVVGVGGGGGNAVKHMANCGIDGVDFICANTDRQALLNANVKTTLQIGCNITKGLGAGANPEIGYSAAMEDRDRLQELIEGADMLFITAGLGGGTGTGAAPVIAQVAKELGILTVAVVTKPFDMEGTKRTSIAEQGMIELARNVDSLITIPNEKLLSVLGSETTLLDAFKSANEVLQGAVQGIAELITRPGLINVDFADVRTVMSEMGMAMMGTGIAAGEDRAREAAEAAVSSPLLEDINLAGANGILVNVTAGKDLAIGEFNEIGDTVKDFASDDATVVIGTVIDPEMDNSIRVTVVATGLGKGLTLVKPEPERMQVIDEVETQTAANVDAPNYVDFDQPPGKRQQRVVGHDVVDPQEDLDLLDIPAFLRRQAD
ncbi:MAG: cell division protein FtsZ [Gammaproteobacteria bacterium]|nr:cell division protein FtsZ [Gammaproteobacteria bacterium]MCP4088611.1 cell division protein FtsZ [Gammaproteobacteria bacterium]MCP4276481.1 cell division protein FtsZ [Gammaproteobacteria bacterium]MCP4832358.1 cell division protein FtsZ [Gammaproteobacteria bacterium]MCP4929128.1 cell division protein FtsZ [Gammaproteobacteria bacterium]